MISNFKSEKVRNSAPARINPNNEVKISLDTDVHQAIDFICNLFQIQKFDTIKICGLSKAIRKVVLITEIVKTKVKGLYQINNIDCLSKKGSHSNYSNQDDMGLVPRLEVLLSFIEPTKEEKNNLGYQAPSNYHMKNTKNKIYQPRKIKNMRKLFRIRLRWYNRVKKIRKNNN